MTEATKVNRRSFLGIAVAAIVAGVVAGVGGYYAGLLSAPPAGAPVTITTTVPGGTSTITQTTTATSTVTTSQTTTATTTPSGKKEIVLGRTNSATGPLAHVGAESQGGWEMAVEDINKQGGVYVKELGGRLPVRFIVYDDQFDPSLVVSNIERLITVDQVDFVVSTQGEDQAMAAATTAEKHQFLVYGGAQVSVKVFEQGFKWFFLPMSTSDTFNDAAMAMLSQAKPKPNLVAILEENTDIGAEYGSRFGPPAAKKYGLNYVVYPYAAMATDLSDVIIKMKSDGVDAVDGLPTMPDLILFLRQSKELGFKPYAWIMSRGASAGEFWEVAGAEYANNVCGIEPWNWDFNSESTALRDRWVAKGNPSPGDQIGVGYYEGQILFKAIEIAGTLNHSKVRDALLTNTFDTMAGPIKFAASGLGMTRTVIPQWQNGTYYTVWPSDLASKPLVYPFP